MSRHKILYFYESIISSPFMSLRGTASATRHGEAVGVARERVAGRGNPQRPKIRIFLKYMDRHATLAMTELRKCSPFKLFQYRL